jgi:hypothetical protein
MKLRVLVTAIALLAAACSPPAATTTETPETPAAPSTAVDDEQTQALLNVLDPVLARDIGQPVSLQPTTVNVRDEWAFIVGQPRQPDGSAIDWSTTSLAQRAADGVLDGDGQTFALLKNVNGAWEVLEYVVGPTDVAHIEWAGKHGVPPDVLGLPSN